MQKKKFVTLGLVLMIVFSFIQCNMVIDKDLNPQSDSSFEQQVYNQAWNLQGKDTLNLSAEITNKDSILYKGNFWVETKTAITETSTFDIFSKGKQFIAKTISILQEKVKSILMGIIKRY